MRRTKAFLGNSHIQEVLKGSATALIVKFIGAALAFAFNVLLARMLGANGAGIYFLSLTVVTIASVVSRFGLDSALLRFTAAGAEVAGWGSVNGVYRHGMVIVSLLSLLVTTALFLLASWISETLFNKSELIEPLRWMSLAIYPMSLFLLHAELLKGLKRIFDSQMIQGLVLPLASIVGLSVLASFWGINGAAISYVLSSTISAAVGIWLWWRIDTLREHRAAANFEWKTLIECCVPLYWVDLINRAILPWAPMLILGFWVSSYDIGIFAVAVRTALLVSFILMAVNAIAAPKFAALYKLGDLPELERLAQRISLLLMVVVIPVAATFFLFASEILMLFGSEFAEGGRLLMVLVLGQLVNVICGPVGYLLIMTGNEKSYRSATLISAAVLIILCIFMVPESGVFGASIASAIALATLNVVTVILVYKKLDIQPLPTMAILRSEIP